MPPAAKSDYFTKALIGTQFAIKDHENEKLRGWLNCMDDKAFWGQYEYSFQVDGLGMHVEAREISTNNIIDITDVMGMLAKLCKF